MNRPGKYFPVLAFCLTFSLVNTAGINAQVSAANFISETLPDLKQISTDLNMNALALLAIIREFEKYGAANNSKVVRVIKPVSPVKETDNLNSRTILEARQNDEFVVTDERDKWYKIRTQDSREGWVAEEDIQMLNKQLPVNSYSNKSSYPQEASVLLDQMNRYKKSVDELYSRAIIIVKKTADGYNNLSKENKVNLDPDYRLFIGYKDRIEKSIGYVRRFSSPYESLLIATDTAKPVKVSSVKRFKETASGDVGRSSYENMNSNSTTSSRFGLNGIYKIDKSTRANIVLIIGRN